MALMPYQQLLACKKRSPNVSISRHPPGILLLFIVSPKKPTPIIAIGIKAREAKAKNNHHGIQSPTRQRELCSRNKELIIQVMTASIIQPKPSIRHCGVHSHSFRGNVFENLPAIFLFWLLGRHSQGVAVCPDFVL